MLPPKTQLCRTGPDSCAGVTPNTGLIGTTRSSQGSGGRGHRATIRPPKRSKSGWASAAARSWRNQSGLGTTSSSLRTTRSPETSANPAFRAAFLPGVASKWYVKGRVAPCVWMTSLVASLLPLSTMTMPHPPDGGSEAAIGREDIRQRVGSVARGDQDSQHESAASPALLRQRETIARSLQGSRLSRPARASRVRARLKPEGRQRSAMVVPEFLVVVAGDSAPGMCSIAAAARDVDAHTPRARETPAHTS